MNNISKYAKTYAERYGWHLVPIEPGRKFPLGKDWGNKTLTEPAQAFAFWESHNDYNMGLALGPSRMCSLDIDDADAFAAILDEFGIPPESLDEYPTIRGKGKRVMFRVPDDMTLPYCKLNWPTKDDHKKKFTVFELRASDDNHQRQDVLPPSLHPDTGKPYEWLVKPPKSLDDWPCPPAWLLAVWTAWESFKPQFMDSCPWVTPDIQRAPPKPFVTRSDVPDVQGEYNRQNRITDVLQRYGYTRKGKRYLSPHSGTGMPGVHIFDGERCWIHHASDPLCSSENNQPVSSFDLFCYYDNNGDRSKAFKAAAEQLGIALKSPDIVVRDTRKTDDIAAPQSTDNDHPTLPPQLPPVISLSATAEPLPLINGNGRPLAHIDNLREICDRLGITIRYNVISKEEEIIIPRKSFSLDNSANASYAWLESECSLFSFPTAKLQSFMTYIADQNLYNPVAQWVSSKPWDGVDRLQDLLNTVHAKDEIFNTEITTLKETLIKRWMTSAIAGAFNPCGVSAHGVLVFQGEQYVGKTKWFKGLVPEELNLTKDGVILKPDDRDSVKQAVSFWLVELGELDSTFRKSDIAALKAFITNDKDVLRRAYARKESQYARRTVFFASVNPKSFLNDPTGNRRYWTIEVEKLDHSHGLDMQQVWAQVYEQLYQQGYSWYLTPDELNALNKHNEDFTALDPIEEIISQSYDWDAAQSLWTYRMTASEVLRECGYERPTKADTNAAGAAIRKMNGNLASRTGKGLFFTMPPKRFNM